MFGQVEPTEFDLRFSMFGIPIRVHPVFWLTSAFLAWNSAGGDPRGLLVCVLAIFVSILVHELGHAVANRQFGWHSEIVLYFFGGYATSTRHTTWKDITVSAAGPLAGFMLYGSLWWLDLYLKRHFYYGNELLFVAVKFSLFINLAWNAFNLIPVLPLDGGQIARELCLWISPRKGMQTCLMISMVTAIGLALWAFRCDRAGVGFFDLEPRFLILMFGYLAFKSYQSLEDVRRGF